MVQNRQTHGSVGSHTRSMKEWWHVICCVSRGPWGPATPDGRPGGADVPLVHTVTSTFNHGQQSLVLCVTPLALVSTRLNRLCRRLSLTVLGIWGTAVPTSAPVSQGPVLSRAPLPKLELLVMRLSASCQNANADTVTEQSEQSWGVSWGASYTPPARCMSAAGICSSSLQSSRGDRLHLNSIAFWLGPLRGPRICSIALLRQPDLRQLWSYNQSLVVVAQYHNIFALLKELGIPWPLTDWTRSGFWGPEGLRIESPVFSSQPRLPTLLGQFVHTFPLFRYVLSRKTTPLAMSSMLSWCRVVGRLCTDSGSQLFVGQRSRC